MLKDDLGIFVNMTSTSPPMVSFQHKCFVRPQAEHRVQC